MALAISTTMLRLRLFGVTHVFVAHFMAHWPCRSAIVHVTLFSMVIIHMAFVHAMFVSGCMVKAVIAATVRLARSFHVPS